MDKETDKNKKSKCEACKLILPGEKTYSCSLGSARWILISGAAIILLAVFAASYFGYHLYEIKSEQQEFIEYKQYKKEKREVLEKMVTDNERMMRDIAELSNLENRLRESLKNENSSNAAESSGEEDNSQLFEQKKELKNISSKNLKALLREQSSDIGELIAERKTAVKELLSEVETAEGNSSEFPDLWPVSNGKVSSGYGDRVAPINGGMQWHPGVDIAVKYGAPVYASAAGIVEKAGPNGAYGKYILLDHENGYKSSYGHMSALSVAEGDHVEKGQIVGYAGSSGYSTGPHVHYEVLLNGKYIDPNYVLKNKGH